MLLVVTALGLFIDLWSKDLAFARIADRPVVVNRQLVVEITLYEGPHRISQGIIPAHKPVVVVPHLLELTLVLNPGAVFGIGPGQRWFFIAFTGVAMVGGLALFAWGTRPRDTGWHVALGLLISGGIGNFYDRLMFGCVRDFLHPLPGVKLGSWEMWPYVSNLADLWLIIGIGTLVLVLWKSDKKKP